VTVVFLCVQQWILIVHQLRKEVKAVEEAVGHRLQRQVEAGRGAEAGENEQSRY
jgi:hypothetical protein